MPIPPSTIPVPAHRVGVLTIVSLAATVIFGIWSVLSYKATVKGNQIALLALQQAVIQNQLALLNWCEGAEQASSEAILHTCTRFAKSLSIPTLASILSSTSPASIPIEWVPPPYYTLTPPPPQFWDQKPKWWPLWLDGTIAPRWMPSWLYDDIGPRWWPSWLNSFPYLVYLYVLYLGCFRALRWAVKRRQSVTNWPSD